MWEKFKYSRSLKYSGCDKSLKICNEGFTSISDSEGLQCLKWLHK